MFQGHPKGLIVAFFSNMGERFGFYTMMAILVMFLQAKYGLAQDEAGWIYSGFYFLITPWPCWAASSPTAPRTTRAPS